MASSLQLLLDGLMLSLFLSNMIIKIQSLGSPILLWLRGDSRTPLEIFHFGNNIFLSIMHIHRTGNEAANIFAKLGVSDLNFINFV